MVNNENLFLSEKFAPAQLPEVFAPRKSLISHFEEAANDGFVFVSAPGGSGKTVTTLLWLQKSKRIPLWIGLDEYDNSPSIFYKQFAAGLYSLQQNNVNMQRILYSTSFSSTPVEHVIELVNEMVPNNNRYVIVLDDFHSISSSEILKSFPAVLRRLPRTFSVFVLSRSGIPEGLLPLVRNKEKDVIYPKHLRFTEVEIKRYFDSLGYSLTSDEAKFACLVTDGWAIGVNAIALSGQMKEGKVYDFAHYFEEQAWNNWDESLRTFCMRTSIVEEFDEELASSLSGREDALRIMDELSKSNSFLSRLHGDTYRYHHLFQDFLHHQLQKSADNTDELYKIAARYYKERGDYFRALRHWFNSGDYKEIDSFLFLFLFRGQNGGVADYADFLRTFFTQRLPDRAFREAPVLHVLYAWYCYLTSNHVEFAIHMDAILRSLPHIASAGNEFIEFAMLAFHVDHRQSLQKQVRAYSLFGRFLKKHAPEGLATDIASFTHNLPYMHRSNRDYSEIALDTNILLKIDHTFAPLLGQEWTYIRPGISACFVYEKNLLAEALKQNEAALRLIAEDNKVDGRICVLVLQHSILWQMQKEREADAIMDELTALTDSSAQYFIPNLNAYRTKLKLYNGELSAAHSWLDCYYVTETDHIEFFRSFQHFTTVRSYIAVGETKRALYYLNMLKEFGDNLHRLLDRCEAGTLLASLYWALSRKKEATEELEETLERLQPYGFIRVVADEGAAIVPVLKRVLTKVCRKDYTGKLDRAYINDLLFAAHSFSKNRKGYFGTIEKGKRTKPIKLSKQQTRMLDLLSKGFKNAEIAEMTGLSIPTIKTHTSLAYRKLGVHNAMDAVLRARELHLIE